MSQLDRGKPKSRFLTAYEFFEAVQIEYICSVLRARIYPKPKDKQYWNKVADGKKQTIEEIASRNHGLPSIFTDSDLEALLSRRVYRESTYPLFVYKDEHQRLNQEYLDLLYYYNKGVDIRFDNGNEIKIGKVKAYKPFEAFVTLTVDNIDIKVPITQAIRIL